MYKSWIRQLNIKTRRIIYQLHFQTCINNRPSSAWFLGDYYLPSLQCTNISHLYYIVVYSQTYRHPQSLNTYPNMVWFLYGFDKVPTYPYNIRLPLLCHLMVAQGRSLGGCWNVLPRWYLIGCFFIFLNRRYKHHHLCYWWYIPHN